MKANKKNESSIRESEELHKIQYYYESIIAKMPGHVFWKDKNGVFLGCNDQQAKTLGLSSWREVIGKTTYDMTWSGLSDEERRKQAAIVDENDRNIMESGVAQVIEEPLTLPDGNEAIYLSNKTPLYDSKGDVIGILGFAFDISEQKKNEALRKEHEIIQRQLVAMKTLAATLAHELRTPLASIKLGTKGVKKFLPDLINAYQTATDANLPIKKLLPSQLKILGSVLEDIEAETHYANTIINMILGNAQQIQMKPGDFHICSISHCIDEALRRYPFLSGEKQLVSWIKDDDFTFMGEELLMIHVLFNLLKNAIYYVKAAGKGDIKIWTQKGEQFNQLHFRDTGKGINANLLPRIFEPFISRTYHGSGIGLAFCKMAMRSFGGDIICESVEGEFAEFILNFPVKYSLSEIGQTDSS